MKTLIDDPCCVVIFKDGHEYIYVSDDPHTISVELVNLPVISNVRFSEILVPIDAILCKNKKYCVKEF